MFGPKVHGAYYLHQNRGCGLQKLQVNFVMSSGAGFMGSPGQSNHSCGNMGLEGLVDFERKLGLTGCSIAWGAVAGVGYAQRHHLADHAGAVRFEHAWACIEAILERPFLNVLISPNAWEMGRGAQAMRQLISAGLAGRFKKTGFRKPKAAPQGELVAETNEIQVIEQRTSDKENLALQGQPAEVLAAPMPEVLESMKKLQLGWNATQSSIEILPKDSVQVLRHKLGENEIY